MATSPDPDDPDVIARRVEDEKHKENIVNERLDPYSGRYFPKEARTEELARIVREEQVVESIVRSRTWGIVRGRCGAEVAQGDLVERLRVWEEDNGKL